MGRDRLLAVSDTKVSGTRAYQYQLVPDTAKPGINPTLHQTQDEEGILCVGGRLENASVPYPHKHAAILPKGSKLSKIYFESLHRLFHDGPLGLLNAVRLKFGL
ncbi:hypothetical protein AVEN_187924-1 [Araneus ventricosus]|uniref:Uncharacterized protein n=1 Tax=Araneus ventricosus TaxID=182803 RepID=A0A4Y2QW10_ARAVE|nr:hypothetical protein AVEN_187924-1 [Araneus ventricosus]